MIFQLQIFIADFQKHEENHSGSKVYRIFQGESPLYYRDALTLMKSDRKFQDFLTKILKECGYDAFVWETVPVSSSSQDQIEFKFAITESKSLDRMSKDTETFAEHFKNSQKSVTSFLNQGRDATLISPLPKWCFGKKDYTHFGKFLHAASDDQIRAFWSEVGNAMLIKLSSEDRPFWLSTAGHGVGWLHMRVDIQPKYYTYSSFKKFPTTTG